MDENKEKEELNDELLEQVSGGNVFTDPPKFVPDSTNIIFSGRYSSWIKTQKKRNSTTNC